MKMLWSMTLFGVDINNWKCCTSLGIPVISSTRCAGIYTVLSRSKSLNTLLRNSIHESAAYIEFNVQSTCGL